MSAAVVLFAGTDNDPLFDVGLWESSGSAAGTIELTPINGAQGPGDGGFSPRDLTVFGHEVLFGGSDNAPNALTNDGLWVTNGTAGGTTELTSDLTVSDLTLFGGEVLFNGNDSLWVTNGTTAGTAELTGITGANPSGFRPSFLTVLNGEVLFNGEESPDTSDLWVTNGTAAGTHEVTGGSTGLTAGIDPEWLTVLNTQVLFTSGTENGLWVTDGTTAGTKELSGIKGANLGGFAALYMATFNGEVLFAGADANGIDGLWVTNGTAAGTVEVTGIAGASSGGIFSGFGTDPEFTVFGSEVLFSGVDANGANSLWVTDGTAAGTHELVAGLEPSDFAVIGGEVLFRAEGLSRGLWETNGTTGGTSALTPIADANSGGISPTSLVAFTPSPTLLSFQNDLTGDHSGLSDVLMTNTHGALVVGQVSGGQESYQQIGGLGPEWQFEGSGLLLGDGFVQFLIWDGSSASPIFGALVAGEDHNGTASYTQIGAIGPEWQFEGVGPLAGGSVEDFLIWDGSSASPNFGALVVGTVSGGTAHYTLVGALGPEWQFEGVGDYLGNGSGDFLIWDTSKASPANGAVVVGEDVNGTAQYTAIGGLDPATWQFAGSGDLLNDGQDSFLIRNKNSGALVVGEDNNGTAQYSQIGAVGPEWQFLGTGNYDGASPAEFLMRSSTSGALVIGIVSGGVASYVQVGAVGSEWNFHTTNTATLV